MLCLNVMTYNYSGNYAQTDTILFIINWLIKLKKIY